MSTYKQLPKSRTTLDLTGTTSRHNTHLDYRSWLALKYAEIWLVAAGSLKPPSAGIIRRALAVYVEHLAEADPNDEARAIRHACQVLKVDDDEQQMAQMRMYADPLPLFADVVCSPKRAAELAATVAQAEAFADSIIADRHAARVNGGKAAAAKRAAAKVATVGDVL